MGELFKEFKFHILAFVVSMVAAPIIAWRPQAANLGGKEMNMVAACLIAAATVALSLAFFKQGVHADAASFNDERR